MLLEGPRCAEWINIVFLKPNWLHRLVYIRVLNETELAETWIHYSKKILSFNNSRQIEDKTTWFHVSNSDRNKLPQKQTQIYTCSTTHKGSIYLPQ